MSRWFHIMIIFISISFQACATQFNGTLPKEPHWLTTYKTRSKDGKSLFTVGQSSDYMVIEARKNFAAYQGKEKIKEALTQALQQKIMQVKPAEIKSEDVVGIVQNTYTELIFEREDLYYDAPQHIQYALVKLDQAELKLKLGVMAKKKGKAWESMINDHFESIYSSLQDKL
jgi:hypothetical protein